ncbi:hypothetical protein HDV00_001520 [Rhizophlyctis rosea]|nr:hypothetical protein HDV00_001520 [Rhizophlyctis rosea]
MSALSTTPLPALPVELFPFFVRACNPREAALLNRADKKIHLLTRDAVSYSIAAHLLQNWEDPSNFTQKPTQPVFTHLLNIGANKDDVFTLSAHLPTLDVLKSVPLSRIHQSYKEHLFHLATSTNTPDLLSYLLTTHSIIRPTPAPPRSIWYQGLADAAREGHVEIIKLMFETFQPGEGELHVVTLVAMAYRRRNVLDHLDSLLNLPGGFFKRELEPGEEVPMELVMEYCDASM